MTSGKDVSESGLSTDGVAERVARGAVNRVTTTPSRTVGEILRANLLTRFNLVLAAMVVVILVAVADPRDTLFGIVLVVNAAIGIVQELRAKRVLDRLTLLAAPSARVRRGGAERQIPVGEVVVDDLLVLRAGDQVPVDGTLLAGEALEMDESLLTGESQPVVKGVGDSCLSGSIVVAGTGRMRAERVGDGAYAARLASEARRFTLTRSELRRGIDWFIRMVSWLIAPLVVVLVWNGTRAEASFREAVRSAVAGSGAVIPQGLVLLTSIAFAVGVVRLGRRRVLVQELAAIEGLARVDTVCFDKTGTLTEGRLVLEGVERLGTEDPRPGLRAVAGLDPVPNATLAAILRFLPDDPGWRSEQVRLFSADRKWSGGVFGGRGTWVLGAPEVVGAHAAGIRERASAVAAEGRRVLVLAAGEGAVDGDLPPPNLRPVALVVLGDTIRSDAADTVRYFVEQGVRPMVISGDHVETAAAVARRVGVPGAEKPLDGRKLPTEANGLAELLEGHTVFGRVTPRQKQAMVRAMQLRGHVVAMTGDGVNDVLALKEADMGVAMGSGSAASRAVAQVVLLDGRFANLPGVVAEGRRIIANIERVANLFITKTVYAVALAVVVVFWARPFPFLPRHLTVAGSLTIGIPAFFLAFTPAAPRARPGFLRRVLRFAVPTGLAAALATFGAYELAISEGAGLAAARTMATITLTVVGLFALSVVARPLLEWKRMLIFAMGLGMVLVFAVPGMRSFFALVIPDPVIFFAGLGVAASTGAMMLVALWVGGWLKEMKEVLTSAGPGAGRSRSRLERLAEEVGFTDERTPEG